jgi:hypothetical protein
MPEYVPPGVVTNPGQPIVVVGKPALESERVPAGILPDTTAAIVVVGTPAKD